GDNNRCLAGNCRVDADCGQSGYCSPSFGSCGSLDGVVAYYCHTCQDECIDDEDCSRLQGECASPSSTPAFFCAYVPRTSR
ncbi:MAG TPA: hypothetical protein VJR89_21435, partial [Polyangiales bacterium]|nr:hypothetical protein [Polyangiales bacterium]